MWNQIAYSFLNFNGATVEVQEWVNNFIPYFIEAWDNLSMLGLKVIRVSKRGPWSSHYEVGCNELHVV